MPEDRPWTSEQLKLRYNPGTVLGRLGGDRTESTLCSGTASVTLTRFTFTDSSGSETELIDRKTTGQPKQWTCGGGSFDRGRIFVSTDGSALTFISTNAVVETNSTWQQTFAATGVLYLPDGQQYTITNGRVASILDRNGNELQFTYRPDTPGTQAGGELASIRDNLGRTYSFEYHEANGLTYDKITYAGFAGAQRVIKVYWKSLEHLLREQADTVQTLKQLFDESDVGPGGQPYNPERVEKVSLPGETLDYTFKYNPYGEVSRVKTPLGGGFEYDYAAGMGSGSGFRPDMIYRRVTARRAYSSFPSTQRLTTSISVNHVSTNTHLEVTTTDYEGASTSILAQNTKKLHGWPTDVPPSAVDYSWWKSAREYEMTIPGFRKVVKTWEVRTLFPFTTGTTGREAGIDPRLTAEETTLEDDTPPKTFRMEYAYDRFNNRTSERVFDFDGTTPLRTVTSEYLSLHATHSVDYADIPLTAAGDLDISKPLIHIRRRMLRQTVSGPLGIPATTTNEYDIYTPDDRHATLAPVGTLTQFSPPNHNYRGNVTGVTRSNTPADITENQLFDNAGNVVKQFDAESGEMTITFSSTYQSAYPTSRSVKVTDAISLVTTFTYDLSTGLLTSRTDPHTQSGVQESYDYTDNLDRLKTFVRAPGTTSALATTLDYTELGTASNYIKTSSSTTSCGTTLALESRVYLDGLGRRVRTAAYQSATAIVQAQTEYDGLNRVKRVSNPYKTSNPSAWTESSYDLLGRVTKNTLPDGTASRISFRSTLTYLRDPAGVWRRELRDPLGRLIEVTEAPTVSQPAVDLLFPGEGLAGVSGSNLVTSYAYDGRDNLRSVTQGSQTRSFEYDAVNRLTAATNPESGPISYTYYGTGSVKTRLDSRENRTTYYYDLANRPTKRTYSNGDPPVVSDTPVITCYGDGTPDGDCTGNPNGASLKGRLTMVKRGSFTTKYSSYDPVGRVLASSQELAPELGVLAFSYAYTTSGWLSEQTYPSQRKVSTCYDALGQVSRVTKGPSSETSHYASEATYAASGALESVKLGNGVVETINYNSRLQIESISAKLGTTNLLALGYEFTSPNNGNLYKQTITTPSGSVQESYTYDGLNRLKTYTRPGTGSQTYSFDRFGNRAVLAGGLIQALTLTPQVADEQPSSVEVLFPNNRWTALTYDAAGNVLNDPAGTGRSYTYDAENRVKTATMPNTPAITYSYDGEGRRVRKEVAGQSTTVFVYDAFGQLAAEYGPADGIGVRYLTVDHLGSTRMVTDQSGTVVKRMDYLPFGEEYPAVGYPSSTERTGVKFTGKEKDAETGLDYFLARYFSSSQGRFTSVDAKGFSKRTLRNPQKWNKYAYVLNNPLQYVDPDGLEELKVTIRTTIPYATTWLGATYNGGPKTTTQMIVETRRMGGASPVRSLTETVHPTKLLWPVKMEATAPKSAQVDGYKYTPEGQVVTIVQDTKNPLAPVPGFLTPGVTANLDIEFDEDADWIRVTGTTSQFPSFDISVTRANGETVPVYHRDPWFNSTLLLFLPHRVDTGQVPLRRSDSEQPRKEHKNCLQNRDGTCVQ